MKTIQAAATSTSITLLLLFSIVLLVQVQAESLRFRNGKFKLVQFTDMHYGESWERDKKSNKMQEDIIRWEKPDLAVISGDAVSGYSYPSNDTCLKGGVLECWKYWTQPLINTKTKWAFIFGNHDDQADLTRSQIIEIDMSYYPQSLTQRGPSDVTGETKYVDLYVLDLTLSCLVTC